MLEKLQEIFRDLMDDEELTITEDSDRENTEEWDSLFQVSLMSVVSDEFDIELDTDDIAGATSVRKIMDIIEREKNK